MTEKYALSAARFMIRGIQEDITISKKSKTIYFPAQEDYMVYFILEATSPMRAKMLTYLVTLVKTHKYQVQIVVPQPLQK